MSCRRAWDSSGVPYTEQVFKAVLNAVRFFWKATAGHRLRPWQSAYLRWRVETYTGKPASTVRASDFLKLLYGERKQMRHFFRWLAEIRKLAMGKMP